MDRHGKLFYVPALCVPMLALVTSSSAGLLSGCKTAEPARLFADDAAITTKIKAKLATDGDLEPYDIAVTTTQGVVTLKGRVRKGDAREKVERYARETDGVQQVIDLVKVGDGR